MSLKPVPDSATIPRSIISSNPANGDVIGEAPFFSLEEARESLDRAKTAQKLWASQSLDDRITVLRRFQHILTERAAEVCELISKENGKPLQEAMVTEVLPVIDLTAYFAKRAKKILADKTIGMHLLKHRRSFIQYRPRGVMLVISPWNYPLTIPAGAIVMGLLAGNAVIQKPASLTPLIALKMRELMDEAGLDRDLFQVVTTSGSIASQMIEMGVDYVNFTGSTEVGRQVAMLCGRLMIPSSMELGGKDPVIVRADADLDYTAGAITWGGLCNAGQTCASVERVYAHESIYDELVAKVTERVQALRVGDPQLGEMDMGPMVDENQLRIVEHQVKDALANGAKALTGGKRIDGPGNFFEPTVLVDVTEDMEVIRDETFGPVIPIMKVRSDEEAIERANHSIYGLTASIFTRDRQRGREIAQRLEAGTVMVNEVLLTHGLPETPWQGVKLSGTGKVHSDQGLVDLCYPYHINEENLIHPPASPFWHPYSDKMYRALLGGVKVLFGRKLAQRVRGVSQIIGGLLH